MRTMKESRLAGGFQGYASGRVYEWSDGACWRREDRAGEYVRRKRAMARLRRERGIGLTYLNAEGT
jgi:hypothetical protein